MPRAVINPGPRLETLASHSDPSIPLVSIHSPSRRPIPDPDDPSDIDAVPTEPRPRPSLQIYYTSPLTTTAEELEMVARTLETAVLKDRFATSSAGYERLDVYALPVVTTEEDEDEEAVVVHKDGRFATLADADVAVRRCVAHQRAEIAARDANDGKEWYIQRYDVAGGEWRRAIVVIRTPVAEWEWGSKEKTGRGLVLSTLMFDSTKDRPEQVLVFSGSTEGEIQVLIHELRHELNWQHSFVQFLDQDLDTKGNNDCMQTTCSMGLACLGKSHTCYFYRLSYPILSYIFISEPSAAALPLKAPGCPS